MRFPLFVNALEIAALAEREAESILDGGTLSPLFASLPFADLILILFVLLLPQVDRAPLAAVDLGGLISITLIDFGLPTFLLEIRFLEGKRIAAVFGNNGAGTLAGIVRSDVAKMGHRLFPSREMQRTGIGHGCG